MSRPYPQAWDRRARVVTPMAPGLPMRADDGRTRRVTVVGGGLAGVAAAVVLAERGVAVTLHESGPVLGGRLSAWPDAMGSGEAFTMERGFHAFFRQYYNVRALLRRIDPGLGMLRPIADYPLYGPHGARESFSNLPARPPFNLMALVRRTPTLGWRELRAIDGEVAAEMLAFDGDDTYARFDSMSAAAYLDAVGFPADARRMLFEVFAHSFFSTEEQMSAAEMLMMFHLYFLGTAEGILFDVLHQPFDAAVWQPLQRVLEALGVEVCLGSRVQELRPPGEDEGVVLAATVEGLQAITAANSWLGATPSTWHDDVAALEQAPPFVVWRVWMDRDASPDRPAFAGTAGMGIVDNISCVHRYQDEARRWAARTGGAVMELHAYAVPDTFGRPLDEQRVKADLLAALHSCYPEFIGAQIIEERFVVRADCPAFTPGSWARRPTVATPHARVVLAGDLVKLPFPTALMERAVSSGFLAANALLSQWGMAPEPVWSIPPRGVLAGLQAWKRRKTAAGPPG